MSRGISRGKQVIKFANRRNRGRVVYSLKRVHDFSLGKCTVRVSTSFTPVLLALRTFTVASASRNTFPSSSLRKLKFPVV